MNEKSMSHKTKTKIKYAINRRNANDKHTLRKNERALVAGRQNLSSKWFIFSTQEYNHQVHGVEV